MRLQWTCLTHDLIDQLIDQVLGYSPADICHGQVERAAHGYACMQCAWCGTTIEPHRRQAPRYSTEWPATREMIARLTAKGWEIVLCYRARALHVTVRHQHAVTWQNTALHTSETDAAVVCHAVLALMQICD